MQVLPVEWNFEEKVLYSLHKAANACLCCLHVPDAMALLMAAVMKLYVLMEGTNGSHPSSQISVLESS